MYNIFSNIFYKIPNKYIDEFKKDKFQHDNIRILLVAAFLIIAELYSAIFITIPGTRMQYLAYTTAFVMFLYALVSLKFYLNKPSQMKLRHKIYQLGIGFFGITIAITRIAIHPYFLMNLPAIYVAVIYGLAVIFYYSYLESLSIYLYGMAILYYVATTYQPILLQGDVFLNGISNSIIAWIASMVIFKKYVNEFLKQKKIESKNKKLNEINEQLRKMSTRDKLTGIYNRRKLEDILQDIYQKAERYNNEFSVILLDLDHFKKINDNYGHQVGDQVLKEVSSILLDSIRNVDYCGRWGGEEFLIILPETELGSAVTLAKRLRKEIEEHIFSKIDILTSSFGVASYSSKKKIKDIIKEADEALYAAKENGRNRVEKMD